VNSPVHVVVVDDDPSILTLLGAALKAGLGARVTTFPSGEAALAGWSDVEAPSAVLTDYSMPGINGLELATQLRARHPQMPIIMLSAVEVPIEAPGVVTKCLTKPCPPRVLLPTLRGLLSLPEPGPGAPPPPPSAPPRLSGLTQKYKGHLAEVRARLDALVQAAGSPEGERALRDQLHQLAGTAGSYGFHAVTEAAIALRGAVVAKVPLGEAAAALAGALELAVRQG
jgi:CheY-like chemotaxis protein